MFRPKLLKKFCKQFQMSVINLFASRINAQVSNMRHGDQILRPLWSTHLPCNGVEHSCMHAFDPFSVIPWMLQKNKTRQYSCSCCPPHLADLGLICYNAHHGPYAAEDINAERPCAPTEYREETSAEHVAHGDNIIQNAFQKLEISGEVITILFISWHEGARYSIRHLHRWLPFCNRREIDRSATC